MLIFVLLAFPARSDTVVLPPIELVSPALPPGGQSAGVAPSAPDLAQSLGAKVPVTATGKAPGDLAQARGFGRGADEVDVQALGVSMNPVQGGGFDLGSAPSFLWESWSWSVDGKAADPRSLGQTIELAPWTERHLEGDSAIRATGAYSGAGAGAVSAAGSSVNRSGGAAAVAGYSAGTLTGPGGMLSAATRGQATETRAHLIGWRLRTNPRGSVFFPTPEAEQTGTRVVPVLEHRRRPTKESEIGGTAFADISNLEYETPGYRSFDRGRQAGARLDARAGAWGADLGGRWASYEGLGFRAPDELSARLGGSYRAELGRATLTPALAVSALEGIGARPEPALAWSGRWGSWSQSARVALAWKYPSLVDRYYQMPGFFEGNAGLKPERSLLAGTSGEAAVSRSLKFAVSLLGDARGDAIVTSPGSGGLLVPANRGTAWVVGARTGLVIEPISFARISPSVGISRSRLRATGGPFPYLPSESGGVEFELADPARGFERSVWLVTLDWDLVGSRAWDDRGSTLPGYGVLGVALGASLSRQVRAHARIENAAGNRYESMRGFPVSGRVVSIGMEAEL